MDRVYKDFIEMFSLENQEINSELQNFTDFYNIKYPDFNDYKINVISLNNGKYFISNCKSKGFVLERNQDIQNITDISSEYKYYQQNLGKISNLFGFENFYFANIIEMFSNDIDSHGLGDYTNEFLERTNNTRVIGGIDIDNLFTIAYEGNGNRIVLTKDNAVYIYAHDLSTQHYEKIIDIPNNTFFKIPGIYTLDVFVKTFFDEFIK